MNIVFYDEENEQLSIAYDKEASEVIEIPEGATTFVIYYGILPPKAMTSATSPLQEAFSLAPGGFYR
jgi:hypothetical protein